MADAIFEVFRGNREGGQFSTYDAPIAPVFTLLQHLDHPI